MKNYTATSVTNVRLLKWIYISTVAKYSSVYCHHHCHQYRGSSSRLRPILTPSTPSSHRIKGALHERVHPQSHEDPFSQPILQVHGGSHEARNPVPLERVPLVTNNKLKPETDIPGPFSPRFRVLIMMLTSMIMILGWLMITMVTKIIILGYEHNNDDKIMMTLGWSMGSRR